MQLGVEPAQLGQLDERVDRPGEFPVDQPNRQALAGDDVPRRHVAVADDLGGPAEVAAVPGEPDGILFWPERGGGPVQVPKHLAERGSSVDAPRTGLDELALDEGQHLAAVVVDAGADQPGRGGESFGFEVPEQRMHGGRPRTGVAQDDVTPAVYGRPAAAAQPDFPVSPSHTSLCGVDVRSITSIARG